jgi:hypothetical protein
MAPEARERRRIAGLRTAADSYSNVMASARATALSWQGRLSHLTLSSSFYVVNLKLYKNPVKMHYR